MERPSIWTIERLLKLVVFACFLVVAGFGFILKQQFDLDRQLDTVKDAQETFEDIQLDNSERAFSTRAIACRLEYAIRLEPSPVCFTDEVLRHWNPENSTSPHFSEHPEPTK